MKCGDVQWPSTRSSRILSFKENGESRYWNPTYQYSTLSVAQKREISLLKLVLPLRDEKVILQYIPSGHSAKLVANSTPGILCKLVYHSTFL